MLTRYETRGIVLSRVPLGETHALIMILTPDLGLIRARAQGVRQSGAKLAAALTTFTESHLVLIQGKEGWRIAGAVLEERWLMRLERLLARLIATRISGLLVRLVAAEVHEPALFALVRALFDVLATATPEYDEEIEILAAVRILALLGFDAGEIPGDTTDFGEPILVQIRAARTQYIARINRGITASGL